MARLGLECAQCGKAAFYFHRAPQPGDVLASELCYVTQGEPPSRGQGASCQHCKHPVTVDRLNDVNLRQYEETEASDANAV